MQNLEGRIYYLDAMRGILMMLGVVLHSAQVFNPAKTWAIFSEHSTAISTYLIEVIHIFRMPTFFIVSGYFCLMTIKKYGAKKFFTIRITRIVIPLLTTAITLNSIQAIILSKTGWKIFNLQSYLLDGHWVAHLWFLLNLIIYFSLAFISAAFFNNYIKSINFRLKTVLEKVPFAIILILLPTIWLAIKSAGKAGLPIYGDLLGIISTHKLLFYLPYFIFGIWLQENPKQLMRFCNINILTSVAIFSISFIIYRLFVNPHSLLDIITYEYFYTLCTWYSTAICFYLFIKFTNYKSKPFSFFSDASYSVYLFHHVIVIALGMLLIHYRINALSGLILLIALTFTITFSIHHYVIKRIPLLSYLFNGKHNIQQTKS